MSRRKPPRLERDNCPSAQPAAAEPGPQASVICLTLARIAAQFHPVTLAGSLAHLSAAGQDAQQRRLESIDRFCHRWTAMRSEDSAIIEAGYHWLGNNAVRVRRSIGLVHGDFNLRRCSTGS